MRESRNDWATAERSSLSEAKEVRSSRSAVKVGSVFLRRVSSRSGICFSPGARCLGAGTATGVDTAMSWPVVAVGVSQ